LQRIIPSESSIWGDDGIASYYDLVVDGEVNPQTPWYYAGLVVSRGVNRSSSDTTLHGEIAAINDYVRQNGTVWQALTLYTTSGG
jgi:hypothetical protein